MITYTLSFGIYILLANIVILCFVGDLIRRVSIKVYFIRHPHVYWHGGIIFLAYLMCTFIGSLSETYTGMITYIIKSDPIETTTVVASVLNRSIFAIAKGLLWYYSVKHGFKLFKDDK